MKSFEECVLMARAVMRVLPTDGIEYSDAYCFFTDPEQYTPERSSIAIMKKDGSALDVSDYEKASGKEAIRSFMVEERGGHFYLQEVPDDSRLEWKRPNGRSF